LPKTTSKVYALSVSKSLPQTTTIEYDDWGNLVKEIRPNGVTVVREFYPLEGELEACPANAHRLQAYLKSETIMPAQSDSVTPARTESYKYKEVLDIISAVVIGQKVVKVGDQVVSTAEYDYWQQYGQDFGRIAEVRTWVPGKTRPTIQEWAYEYHNRNLSTGTLKQSVTTTSFDALTVKDETILCMRTGLLLSQTDDAGIEDTFEYDAMKRLVRASTAVGTSYEATIRNQYTTNDSVEMITTDSKGAKVTIIMDGLERVCEVHKQDDYFGAPWPVQERKYNHLGQCVEAMDIDYYHKDGSYFNIRSTKYLEYDNWGKVCRIVDEKDVVTLISDDPITLTQTVGIEGRE
jgi:hypothetical protein